MKNYKCDFCPKLFKHKYNLIVHVKKFHENPNSDKKNFDENSKKSRQLNSSKDENQEIKQVPGTIEAIRVQSENVKEKIPEDCAKKYTCEKCSKQFIRKDILKSHIKIIHDDIKDFKCDNCGKTFGKNAHLKRHQDHVHNGTFNHKCDKCSKQFTRKDNLIRHIEFVHNRIKKISSNEAIAKSSTADSKIKPESHENEKSFETHSQDVNKMEEKMVEHEQSKDEPKFFDTFAQAPKTKIIQCDSCSESFKSRFNLRKHKAEVHEGDKKFKCEECPSTFGQKLHLKVHVKRKHFIYSDESSDFAKSTRELENEPMENQIEQNEEMENEISVSHEMHVSEKLTEVCTPISNGPETVRRIENQVSNTSSEDNENEQNAETNEEKKYKCRFCNEAFSEKSAIQKHITHMHFEDIAIVKSNKESLQNSKQELKEIEVKNMDQITNDVKSIDSKVEKSNDKYCEKCQKYFRSRKNLKRHTDAVHLKIKKYKCDECAKPFAHLCNLKSHVESIHERLKKFKCNHCSKSFSQITNLKSHVECIHKKLKKFKCDKCPKLFGNRSNLKAHVRCVYEKQKKVNKIQDAEHLVNSNESNTKKDPQKKVPNNECDQCNKIFVDRRYLKQHISDVHLKLRNHKCSQCSRSFGHISNLKAHIKCVHEKLKRFKCDQCQISFSLSSRLKRHIECVHEKLKKFKCDHCSLSFGQGGTLMKHTYRVHEKLKKFKCEQCPKGYAYRQDLKLHFQKVHPEAKSNSNQS